MKIFLIVLAIVVIAVIFLVGIYNRLVALLNEAKNSFAQIDVQLKRRYDLIPNLVEIAKKYMSYEESVLVKVVNARNLAIGALETMIQLQLIIPINNHFQIILWLDFSLNFTKI